ncbi:MAG: hypothetical protein GX153_01000 [Clostridiaceae bacterium]|nr:hypothetical protein [Clostridiaceae bacterium]
MAEQSILVLSGERGTEAILLLDGRPAEWIFPAERAVNDVFLGVCGRIHTGMSSVFVDIGADHEALLPLSRTTQIPTSGSRLPVQIRRVPREGDKGPVVDTQIRLPGRYAVAVPGGRGIRRSLLSSLLPEQAERLYSNEEAALLALWTRTLAKTNEGTAPRRLLSFGDPVSVALREWDDAAQIHVEGIERFDEVKTAAQDKAILRRLSLWVPDTKGRMRDAFGLEAARRDMASDRTPLPCGGFLVIEQTRALLAVDVNSGTAEAPDPLRLAEIVNTEAAQETARQMRLRNLSGTILIDFMRTGPEGREQILELFVRAAASDRGKVRIEGFTGLGLLELARTGI